MEFETKISTYAMIESTLQKCVKLRIRYRVDHYLDPTLERVTVRVCV